MKTSYLNQLCSCAYLHTVCISYPPVGDASHSKGVFIQNTIRGLLSPASCSEGVYATVYVTSYRAFSIKDYIHSYASVTHCSAHHTCYKYQILIVSLSVTFLLVELTHKNLILRKCRLPIFLRPGGAVLPVITRTLRSRTFLISFINRTTTGLFPVAHGAIV